MDKKTCNIVLDLLPGYIENDLTSDTKDFVENHIKTCDNCKKTLENMKGDIIKGQDQLQDDTKIEIEKIKKVKKSFKTRKTILMISSIILSIIILIVLSMSIYKNSHKTLFDEIKDVYNSNITLDSAYIKTKLKYTNYNDNDSGSFLYNGDVYFKDGKYKIFQHTDFLDTNIAKESIVYGNFDSPEYSIINLEDKTHIHYNSRNTPVISKNIFEYLGINSYIQNFENLDFKDVEIKTYDDKEWYVYKKTEKSEIWIDKDTLTNIRYIEQSDKHYRESLYTLESTNVSDKDINIDYDTSNFEKLYY